MFGIVRWIVTEIAGTAQDIWLLLTGHGTPEDDVE